MSSSDCCRPLRSRRQPNPQPRYCWISSKTSQPKTVLILPMPLTTLSPLSLSLACNRDIPHTLADGKIACGEQFLPSLFSCAVSCVGSPRFQLHVCDTLNRLVALCPANQRFVRKWPHFEEHMYVLFNHKLTQQECVFPSGSITHSFALSTQ